MKELGILYVTISEVSKPIFFIINTGCKCGHYDGVDVRTPY